MPNNQTPTAYELTRGRYNVRLGLYDGLESDKTEKLQEGGVLSHVEISKDAGMTEAQYAPEANLIGQSNDKRALATINKRGATHFGDKVIKSFNENLEGILNSTPNEDVKGLEASLPGVKPKDNEQVPASYKEAADAHRKAHNIHSVLTAYMHAKNNRDEESVQKLREKMIETYKKEFLIPYYARNEDEKKKNKDFINAVLAIAAGSEQFIPHRLEGLMVEYIKKMKEHTGEGRGVVDYMKAAIDKKQIRALYLRFWKDLYESAKQQQKAETEVEKTLIEA